MSKSPDAFRTISEVADWLDTPAHVLRFWESKFPQVKPVKRAGGRRYYRPEDMALLGGIKSLLHDQGMTIKGAQKLMREKGVKFVASLGPSAMGEEDATLIEAKAEPAPAPVDNVIDIGNHRADDTEPEAAGLNTDLAQAPSEIEDATELAAGTPVPEAADDTAAAPLEPAPEAEPEEAPEAHVEMIPDEAPEPAPVDQALSATLDGDSDRTKAIETEETATAAEPAPVEADAMAGSDAPEADDAADVWDEVAADAPLPAAATLEGAPPETGGIDDPQPSVDTAAEATTEGRDEPAAGDKAHDAEAEPEAAALTEADADAWDDLAAYRPTTPRPDEDADRHPLAMLLHYRPGQLANRAAQITPLLNRLDKIAQGMQRR